MTYDIAKWLIRSCTLDFQLSLSKVNLENDNRVGNPVKSGNGKGNKNRQMGIEVGKGGASMAACCSFSSFGVSRLPWLACTC